MIGITLVRGLPGSGKSTYAKSLGIRHYESDMYHMENGVYKFKPENLPLSHGWCFQMACNVIKGGNPVVVSNTFTRIVEMRGNYGSIHDVPQHTLDNMRNRWEYFPEGILFPNAGRG